MICPRCDKQGLICKAELINLGVMLHICDECHASWPINQAVNLKNFKDLTAFLQENHLTYENAKIRDLGYVNSTDERSRAYFNVSDSELLRLIDEAWAMKKDPLPFDSGAYVIDMKRIIGMEGESGIKIIVQPGTSDIKTAYPIKIQGKI